MSTSTDNTAERMTATLAVMLASGYLKSYPRAMMAYDPREGVLYAVLDESWDGTEEDNEPVTDGWLKIHSAAQEGGCSGTFARWPEDTADFPCVELEAVETMSWRIDVPRAPWDYREDDHQFLPWSVELITHAINHGDPFWRNLFDEIELAGVENISDLGF